MVMVVGLLRTDLGAGVLFTAKFRENKTLAKISEFSNTRTYPLDKQLQPTPRKIS